MSLSIVASISLLERRKPRDPLSRVTAQETPLIDLKQCRRWVEVDPEIKRQRSLDPEDLDGDLQFIVRN